MKKLISLALTFCLIASLFSVMNVSAASLYEEKDLLSGSRFNSTAVITNDGTNKTVSNDLWNYSTVAGIGSTNKDISEVAGITVDDGKTLLSKSDREGVKIYAIANNNGLLTDALKNNASNPSKFPLDFDGKIGAHNDFQGLDYMVVSSTSGDTTIYNSKRDYNYTIDFVIDLGSVCDISGFMVSGSNSERFVPGMYRIYASKERATIYHNKPLIDFTDNYSSDAVAKANANAIYELAEGNKVYARYVALRVADTCSMATKDTTVAFYHNNLRAAEFAVYGTPVALKEGVSATVETSNTPAAPEGYSSLVSGYEAEAILPSKTDANDSKKITKTVSNKVIDGIYAEGGYDDFTIADSSYGQQSQTLGYTVDDQFYSQVTLTVSETEFIKKIQVVGHTNYNLAIGRYVLFAGNDKATLYSPENIIVDYDNSTIVNNDHKCAFTGNNANLITRQQVFDFGTGFKAKYVGMRVYDTCAYIAKNSTGGHNYPSANGGAVYLRLHEFNVLGQPDYAVTNYNYSYAEYQNNVDITRSLIADKSPVYTKATNYLTGDVDKSVAPYYVGVDGAMENRTMTDSKNIPIGNMIWHGAYYAVDDVNGKATKHIDNGVDMYQIIAYDMDKPRLVEKLTYMSHTSSALQLYKYQISFADSADALFTNDAVYTTDVITSTGSASSIVFKKEIVAQYVAFKVVSGVRPSAVGSYNQGTSALDFVNARVPAIYGYKAQKGEKGQLWSVDVYSPILEDVTVTPLYEKDSSMVYNLVHNKIDGTADTRQVQFDERVVLEDAAAESFKVGGSVIGGADTASFYAAGDITVDSSTDAAPTEPTATILNAIADPIGERYSWRIFAHAYVPEGYTAVKTGALFVSPYTEKQLSKNDISEWTFATLNSSYAYINNVSNKDGAEYAMLNLNNVSGSDQSAVIRKAKAYVAYTADGDDTVKYAYSDIATHNFGIEIED